MSGRLSEAPQTSSLQRQWWNCEVLLLTFRGGSSGRNVRPTRLPPAVRARKPQHQTVFVIFLYHTTPLIVTEIDMGSEKFAMDYAAVASAALTTVRPPSYNHHAHYPPISGGEYTRRRE